MGATLLVWGERWGFAAVGSVKGGFFFRGRIPFRVRIAATGATIRRAGFP